MRPTRGAISPARQAFDLIQRNGQRILVVEVTERAGTFRANLDMGEREDWFTSVDGLVPSLGFAGAVFDHKNFNHAYVSAHVAYKVASNEAGYSLGFERPLFRPVSVFVGGELYDLTATDDQLAAVRHAGQPGGPDGSRKHARLLPPPRRPAALGRPAQLGASRCSSPGVANSTRPLGVESDFSVWNGDDEFRPNAAASPKAS